ncbi:reverse transcriptase family protein [Mesorhizobium sp. WSM4976]|uniref:reverse transcriptase family protein n=1 Tax=Mesorhizobium sp. WSM4976 TaxID=3038549 RepID=UPI002417B6E9|nr:reverse transcriptase family protein [Mesorhizobium sp. WSM4976]MDG4898591.1 reverse transcriptase family protein [Mesorhizobium sp. WSM4976]
MKHPWSSQRFREGARAVGRDEEVIAASIDAATAIKRSYADLPVVLTINHLAHLAGVPVDILQSAAFRKEDGYRVFRVKKRGLPNGAAAAPPRRYRTICVPRPGLMRVQRWLAQNVLNLVEPHRASFAFFPGRDLVGAAKRHLEAKWLVKMDVRHFFESISERQVFQVFRSLGYGSLLSFQLARVCTRVPEHAHGPYPLRVRLSDRALPYGPSREGHLPQGAPSSPMLANLVMREFDERVELLALEAGWTYSRYADDMAFSRRDHSSRAAAMHLVKLVESQLTDFGLRNHRQKTTIIPPGARKILLGVLVDSDRPRLTRAFKNNIETHLFALLSTKVGPASHRVKRGFDSTIGMRRHIEGLIAFAHQVDARYAANLYEKFNSVDWSI